MILKCVMLLTITCINLNKDIIIIDRHMAVTPFKFLPLFRKPENAKTFKRSGVRVVVMSRLFKIFFSDMYCMVL